MRRNPVSFALTVGMALLVALFGFTLLSAAGLVGFAADDALVEECGVSNPDESQSPPLSTLPVAAATPSLTAAQADEIVAGDALFKDNCAQCHAVNEQVVGPALAGISKRRPMSWIVPWVKNSSKVVASGDEYAVALYTKFNKQQMPSFALSDKEIASIVADINSEEGAHIATAATAATVAAR